jgi:hypothetical protein
LTDGVEDAYKSLPKSQEYFGTKVNRYSFGYEESKITNKSKQEKLKVAGDGKSEEPTRF